MVSAVIILRLVEQGYLSLADKPQRYITTWPLASTDPLFNMTLEQLLSFTSGLTTEPPCQNFGGSSFESCVNTIATTNAGNGITPGQEFYYASTHLQVAGLMAIKARGVATWQDVFTEFKAQTGLFLTASYDLPSATNPRLAGGMHWTGDEYMAFLKALKNGSLLNSTSMGQLLADHTARRMTGSPALVGAGEDWHYARLWHECQSATIARPVPESRPRLRSLSAWDRSKGLGTPLASTTGRFEWHCD
jgi:CubicO group peptidase (beta-lactamase class C family)